MTLFMGYFGNGCLCSDKDVIENGDYKKIAHISIGGNIQWYIAKNKLPANIVQRIEEVARATKVQYQQQFMSRDTYWQYEQILNSLSASELLEWQKDTRPFAVRIVDLRQFYFDNKV